MAFHKEADVPAGEVDESEGADYGVDAFSETVNFSGEEFANQRGAGGGCCHEVLGRDE